MKTFILFFTLLFSTLSYSAPYYFKGTDFAPFPLSTSNTSLILGVWRGEALGIKIEDSKLTHLDMPLLWIEFKDYQTGRTRKGMLYYSKLLKRYSLYMLEADKNISIEMGVFEFSSVDASQLGMKCKFGGVLMKIQFKIDNFLDEIRFIKETCF